MTFDEWWHEYIEDGGKTHMNIFADETSSREAWNAAIAEEREACIKTAEIAISLCSDPVAEMRKRSNVELRGAALPSSD